MTKSTEIGQVRGLGSAHHGGHHWLLMQATSAGSLITCAYLVFSFLLLDDFSHAAMTSWLQGLGPSFALALLVISVFWHARLGMQILIDDYVHNSGLRFASHLALDLTTFAGAAFGLLCLIRIALGGAAA